MCIFLNRFNEILTDIFFFATNFIPILLHIRKKNKAPQRELAPAKYKQIVETRAEPDWFCGSFFPTEWPDWHNFFGDDASICGYDLCSVTSLGGASLCGVFIEDDPNRNPKEDIVIRNQILKEAKSWGSVRSRSTLG